MINRKSQAALEFIMTYGWAILVVLVAIGALAYFGVLSPDRFLPSRCSLQSGIACLDHKVTATSIEVFVKNGLGYDITVQKIQAEQCSEVLTPGDLANGAERTYVFTVCDNPGSKYSGDFNISYTNVVTQITHKNQGVITTRVE